MALLSQAITIQAPRTELYASNAALLEDAAKNTIEHLVVHADKPRLPPAKRARYSIPDNFDGPRMSGPEFRRTLNEIRRVIETLDDELNNSLGDQGTARWDRDKPNSWYAERARVRVWAAAVAKIRRPLMSRIPEDIKRFVLEGTNK
jgi:hypothetical protein